MKHFKTLIFCLFIVLWSTLITAQNMDLKWSQQYEYSNKNGYFKEFLGINQDYVYARMGKGLWRPGNKDFKIVAFEKESMKEVAKKVIIGFNSKDDKHRGMSYYKTIVFDSVIYILWTKRSNGREELFAESFSPKLKLIGKISRIFSHDPNEEDGSRGGRIMVLNNGNAGNFLVVGNEIKGKKTESIRFRYCVMDEELHASEDHSITLPLEYNGTKIGVNSNYSLGNDGRIYVNSRATITEEDDSNRSSRKKNKKSYAVLTAIEPENGEMTYTVLKFKSKTVVSFGFDVNAEGSVKMYGFFADIKDESGRFGLDGIYYVVANDQDVNESEVNFTYFDKATLDELFDRDENSIKINDNQTRKSKRKNNSDDDEELNREYVIEQVIAPDNEHLVIFCSVMHNYTVQNCTTDANGRTTCRTEYYCNKHDVTVFKIDSKGELIWAKNHKRFMHYSGWDIYDIKVAMHGDSYYTIYGSTENVTARNSKRIFKKKEKNLDSKFVYAVFDDKSGEVTKETFVVDNSKVNTRIDKKYVDPTNTFVFDNEFYVNSLAIRRKPGITALLCITSPLCIPYLLLVHPISFETKGHIGRLVPVN